jgi:hypothetical protein
LAWRPERPAHGARPGQNSKVIPIESTLLLPGSSMLSFLNLLRAKSHAKSTVLVVRAGSGFAHLQ